MFTTMKETVSFLSCEMHDIIIEELSSQNIPLVPVLNLEVIQSPMRDGVVLDHADIIKLFSYYGEVLHVTTKHQEAKVHFKKIESAYFAQKTLHRKFISDLDLTLLVTWNSSFPIQKSLKPESFDNEKLYKYTCKYEIEISSCSEFQVARRIIGPKGKNMKKIIEICSQPGYSQEIIKLRLRGRGSGFKEGPYNEESFEPLHLCVSSKNYDRFQMACFEVEKLIKTVYSEYQVFLKKKGMEIVELGIKTMN